MEPPIHSLNSLFEQLGLENTEEFIEDFINLHKPIDKNMLLYKAEFWSASQASFLQQAIEEDADWSEVVDYLDSMLR